MCVSLSSCQSWLHRNRSGGALFDPTQAAFINKFPSADFQKGIVGQPLDEPLKVMVTDAEGNPVSGVSVTFTTIGDSGGIPLSETATTNRLGIAEMSYVLGENTNADPILMFKNPNDEFPYQVCRHLISATVLDTTIQLSEPFYAFAFPGPVAHVEPLQATMSGCVQPFFGVYSINYKALDIHDNPVANVPFHFETDGSYEFLGDYEEPDSYYPPKLVYLTYTELNECGAIILDKENCGNQVTDIELKTHENGQVWVYPIMGDIAPAKYFFTVSYSIPADPQPVHFEDTVERFSCGFDTTHTPYCTILYDQVMAPVNAGGEFIEAYRVSTDNEDSNARPIEIVMYKKQENQMGCYDPPTLVTEDATVYFAVDTATQSEVVTPEEDSEYPYETILTLGKNPGKNKIHYYIIADICGTTITTDSRTTSEIWGLKGRIEESNPELIALDDDDVTMNNTILTYTLEPPEYPVANTYIDIYENNSRLYLSGAPTDNALSLPEGMLFDWDNTYKAQLVLNKYYEWDLELKFDIWDDDPEVSEQKELYFIKMNWVDLEGNKAEYATPLDPEELEPYDHDPGEPGGPGGFGGPPEDSTFSYLVDPFRFENVTIDMEVSPQVMTLDLVSNVSEYAESFTLYRYGMGAFIDENETLSITMTDKPERDDTKLEELTSFTITPIFGEMKNLELYETGVDTNIFRSRRLEIVIRLDQYPSDGIADTLEMTLTSNLAPGIIVTETLTETDLDTKTFNGPGEITLTLDHFSDSDSVAQDDIRAIVTCPFLHLANAFIDARETDLSSLEFRTDVLHNKGEPGSGFIAIGESMRKIKIYANFSSATLKDESLSQFARLYLLPQGVQQDQLLLEGDPLRYKIIENPDGNGVDSIGKYWYLKNFRGEDDITITAVKNLSEPYVPSTPKYSDNLSTKIIVSTKGGDIVRIMDDEFNLRDLGVVKIDLELEGLDEKDEENIGGFIPVNADNDNNSSFKEITLDDGTSFITKFPTIRDIDATNINGEDDLIKISLNFEKGSLKEGSLKLEKLENGRDKIRIWKNQNKNTEVTLPKEWSIDNYPENLWIEGIKEGDIERQISITLKYVNNEKTITKDTIRTTVTPILRELSANVQPGTFPYLVKSFGYGWAIASSVSSNGNVEEYSFKIETNVRKTNVKGKTRLIQNIRIRNNLNGYGANLGEGINKVYDFMVPYEGDFLCDSDGFSIPFYTLREQYDTLDEEVNFQNLQTVDLPTLYLQTPSPGVLPQHYGNTTQIDVTFEYLSYSSWEYDDNSIYILGITGWGVRFAGELFIAQDDGELKFNPNLSINKNIGSSGFALTNTEPYSVSIPIANDAGSKWR